MGQSQPEPSGQADEQRSQEPLAAGGDPAGSSRVGSESVEDTIDYAQLPASDRVDPPAGADLPAAFGRYAVRRTLGRGGFGIVYLGHDTQLDRAVATKVLRGGPNLPPEEAERFLHEARRVARLHHPGIVTVHDVGLQDQHVYLVADFIEGASLLKWLRQHPPPSPACPVRHNSPRNIRSLHRPL